MIKEKPGVAVVINCHSAFSDAVEKKHKVAVRRHAVDPLLEKSD